MNALPVLAALLMAALLLGVPATIAYRDVRSGRRDPGLTDGDLR